ncbi:MAG: hypothetical protein HZC40_19855 [Chloroflexi bacterium]|nr:hypothetical protein [Chloroflexota bacterium]
MPRFALVVLLFLSACAPAPARIIVEWTTATEINTAGFNLYRGTRAEGPFDKVNAQLIAASPDAITGGKYRYEDTTVIAGQTYYYELEDVEFGGKTERHGPIIITAPGVFGIAEIAMLALGGVVLIGFALVILKRSTRGNRTGTT